MPRSGKGELKPVFFTLAAVVRSSMTAQLLHSMMRRFARQAHALERFICNARPGGVRCKGLSQAVLLIHRTLRV